MININELEDRWLKYKIKSYIPYIVILLSIAIIITIFTLFNSKSVIDKTTVAEIHKENTPEIQVQNVVIEPIKDIPNIEIKKESIAIPNLEKTTQRVIQNQPIQEKNMNYTVPIYNPNKKTMLAPSLDFMSKLQDNTLPYFDNEREVTVNKPNQEKSVQKNTQHTTAQKKQKVQIEPIKKQSSIQIDRQNTHDDINQVIKRFKKNNNPALSLFIAKKYYQLGEYHQSYNYSLMTNEINNDIEASWIIFAKSLVKLNEKSMAVETLNKYIAHSSSNRAKILLDEINSGKFK